MKTQSELIRTYFELLDRKAMHHDRTSFPREIELMQAERELRESAQTDEERRAEIARLEARLAKLKAES